MSERLRFRLEHRLSAGSTAVGLLVTDLSVADSGPDATRVLKVAVDAPVPALCPAERSRPDRWPRGQLMTSATEYARAGNPGSTAPVRVQNRSRTSAAGSGTKLILLVRPPPARLQ